MTRPSRRRVLRLAGVGVTGALAGCVGSLPLVGGYGCRRPPTDGGEDYTELHRYGGSGDSWLPPTLAVDGTTAVVGTAFENELAGRAYVLERVDCGWTRRATLTPERSAFGSRFGSAVAVAGDTVLVGADLTHRDTRDGHAHDDSGAVDVFERTNDGWTRTATLAPSRDDMAGRFFDSFGWEVALSGNRAVVGALGGDAKETTDSGAVSVFERSGGEWRYDARLTASDAERYDEFGDSIALAGDTMLVGARNNDNENGTEAGAVYWFERDDDGWTQRQHVYPDDGTPEDHFGSSVSLVGNLALVGAPGASVDGTPEAGAVYVYERTGTPPTWGQREKLVAPEIADHAEFGTALAFDGTRAVVGATYDAVDGTTPEVGRAYVFELSSEGFRQTATLRNDVFDRDDRFGVSVALSGRNVFVGGIRDRDPSDDNFGPAHVYLYRP